MDNPNQPTPEEKDDIFREPDAASGQKPVAEAPKFRIKLADGREVNTLENITNEEVLALPEAEAIITDQSFHSSKDNLTTHRYFAYVYLDPRTQIFVPLDPNQYNILTLLNKKRFVDNQFTVRCKVRLFETKWPTKSYYSAEIIFSRKYLKIARKIADGDPFITNLLLRLEMDHIDKKYTPWLRYPQQGDQEPGVEDEAKADEQPAEAQSTDPNGDNPL
jgi:hypothetical protein